MRRIIVSVGVIAVTSAVAIGAATAYFSDTEMSEGNTMAAGTLDLSINGQNPLSGPIFSIGDMKPGFVKEVGPANLKITENPGKLFMEIRDIQCDQGVQTKPEIDEEAKYGADWYMDRALHFSLRVKSPEAGNRQMFLINQEGEKVIRELIGKWIYIGIYKPNRVTEIFQSFRLDDKVTNWAQGDKCAINEQFLVNQISAPNPDNTIVPPLRELDCDEGLDNDEDGKVDSADPDCHENLDP